MKTSVGLRRKYICSTFIKGFFKHYGIILLIFITIALLSIFTGVFSVGKYDGGLNESDLFDKVLLILADGKLTFWNTFFNRVFWFLLLIVVSFLTAQNKFLILINVLVMMVLCYLIGIDIGIIFSIFSMRGILFTLIVYIPLMLISILTLIMLNCVLLKKGQEFSKYGTVCNKKEVLTVCLIMLAISLLIQCALFPIFNNIFIIIE